MPVISVIVPVYNAEKYIHRCVDSILGQTFRDFELILVDDGSPDTCGAICDAYAVQDSRVRVLHQPNGGQAAARNRGVAAAAGEWICFVDSDDLIHPQMLEHLYRAARETGAGISCCGMVEAEVCPVGFAQPVHYSAWSELCDEALLEKLHQLGEHRYWVICGKLIRRALVERYPMAEGRIYEDNAIAFRWLHEAETVANTENRYYFYQRNETGTTKSAFSLKKLDFLWALETQMAFYKSVGYARMYRKICAYYLTTAAWYSRRVHYELNLPKQAAPIRRKMRQVLEETPLQTLPVTKDECRQIRDALHPHRSQLKRLPRVCADTLKNGGLRALTARIRRRLGGGCQ